MKGVPDTIWEITGIQTSILLNPDSYISFTGCHCQFTESNFSDITCHFNDVVKTLKTGIFSTSCLKDFISLRTSDSKQRNYSSLSFFPLFFLNKLDRLSGRFWTGFLWNSNEGKINQAVNKGKSSVVMDVFLSHVPKALLVETCAGV